MAVEVFTLIVCCVLAAILGFVAHRASICTVRAVAEILHARTAFMLASIGKSALWIIALTVPFLWLSPAHATGINGWHLTLAALAGGFMFGFGAAINGGCAYSTMTRLVDGELRMALSIGGFAAGIFVYVALVRVRLLEQPQPAPAYIGSVLAFGLVLSLALLAWAIYELPRIWHKRARRLRIKEQVLAPQYRLSSAALVIGVVSAAIFLLMGSPGYTITLQNLVQGLTSMGSLPPLSRILLLLAVLAGMAASTLQRGSFRLDWRPQFAWLRNIFGGALMGLGTAMLPGGNDALVLYGVPSFSPHALPAFIALAIGAALGLLAMRHIGGIDTRVVCKSDIYRAEDQPRRSILNSHAPKRSA
jgi:hypothetical protein